MPGNIAQIRLPVFVRIVIFYCDIYFFIDYTGMT